MAQEDRRRRCEREVFQAWQDYFKGKLDRFMDALFAGAACNLAHLLRRVTEKFKIYFL
ncbi:MAG TPA: hypothetical protein PKD37_03875 [Oligoflexia bacterium]|nr:hypothetical protein [Oligoflexia bacterium]HMP27106.1 hypothetical protein [Oligoflexia bacterium]